MIYCSELSVHLIKSFNSIFVEPYISHWAVIKQMKMYLVQVG
jgi:hypothetical protein